MSAGTYDVDDFISIHAPAEGATYGANHGDRRIYNFNPRSRGGSDTSKSTAPTDYKISIHAPAEGATERILDYELGFTISIHAPAEGATVHCLPMTTLFVLFQSTLPRRERRAT